ncbi:MAG: adenylate/guanylate cyclase domain-containing protein [Bacteroidota bacterium]
MERPTLLLLPLAKPANNSPYRIILWLGALMLLPVLGWTQPLALHTDQSEIILAPWLEVKVDSAQEWTFEQVQQANFAAQTLSENQWRQKLDPQAAYWIRFSLTNPGDMPQSWMLYNPDVGKAEVAVQSSRGTKNFFASGKYVKARDKPLNEGAFVHIPLSLQPGETLTVWMRIIEQDYNAISLDPRLISLGTWKPERFRPLLDTVTFFQGIFWVMIIYNLILFLLLRRRAYLYYAGYLLSLSVFILFAIGPLSHPSVGDPRYLMPLGYLAFGSINICYFLFGRSLLDLKSRLPGWDRFLQYYIGLKLIILLSVQVMLFFRFDLNLALNLEFAMSGLDLIISAAWFWALARTGYRLAWYFIIGSSSVLYLGLTLAVLGHIFDISHTFTIFLGSIVVEILFFSLGLGYKAQESEREKLQAERARRETQEALNQELSKINTAFGRFVPHEFLKALGHESVLEVALGDGVEKEVTVLFSDIRAYTTLSEQMTPQENFHFLNAYLGRMGPVIQRNHGFVNQYYGDGIMALFLESPQDAVQAALEMQEALILYNEARSKKGRSPIRIGLGLHTGSLMMGVIGDTLRMEAGVVADTVNVAARMEGLTKHYHTDIVVSEACQQKVAATAPFSQRSLGRVQVKGKQQAMQIYEIWAAHQGDIRDQSLDLFQAGIQAYHEQQFAEAARAFDQVIALNPEDKTARFFQEKATHYLLEGVEEGWTGTEMMVGK